MARILTAKVMEKLDVLCKALKCLSEEPLLSGMLDAVFAVAVKQELEVFTQVMKLAASVSAH